MSPIVNYTTFLTSIELYACRYEVSRSGCLTVFPWLSVDPALHIYHTIDVLLANGSRRADLQPEEVILPRVATCCQNLRGWRARQRFIFLNELFPRNRHEYLDVKTGIHPHLTFEKGILLNSCFISDRRSMVDNTSIATKSALVSI